MKYFDSGHSITITWSIFKGASSIRESFSNSNLKVYLTGAGDSMILTHSINSAGDLVMTTPNNLSVGVYSIKAVWVKNDGNLPPGYIHNRNMMTADVQNLFAISNSSQYATTDYSVTATTGAVPFGTDGLTVYQLAVMHGLTTKTESAWTAEWQAVMENETTRQENESERQENEEERQDNALESVIINYGSSVSATDPTTVSNWSQNIPSVLSGEYLWSRMRFIFGDESTKDVYSVGLLSLANAAVLVAEQPLTSAQKFQARTNIGATIPVVQQTNQTVAINPGCFNKWATAVTGLNITLTPGVGNGVIHEYLLEFQTGELISSISFSPAVEWIGDSDLEPYHKYQVSVANGVAVMGGIELEQELL